MSKFIGTRITLPNLATPPASPAAGDAYYNTEDSTAYVWNGTSWLDLASGGGGSGDITSVAAGYGLTDGGTSGAVTLNVGAGTGITVNPDNVAIDTTVVPVKTDNLGVFAASASAAIGVGTIELGHATDTTLSRYDAGTVAVEGVALVKTNDSRLSDARTPTSTLTHASSHASAGGDPVTLSASQISGTAITAADTGTVTSAMIANGAIVNEDINASAAIADTKLATISTAGKVSNSATTATDANTASAIVARDASGNFSAGAISLASVNKVAITAPATSATLTIADGSTLATSGANSITLTSTGTSNATLPLGTKTLLATDGNGSGLTSLTAGNLSGTIPSTVLANSSVNVGTTSVALNRASASLALTGISSVAMPGSTSGTLTVQPAATAGTNTITIPGVTDTLVGKATADTLTNKSLSDSTSWIVDAADNTKRLNIDVTGTTGITGTLQTAFTTAKTIAFPDLSGTVALIGSAQTFTAAQTFRATNAVRSEAASTQDAVVIAGRAGGTSSYAATLTPTTLTASRTLTLPDETGTVLTSATTGLARTYYQNSAPTGGTYAAGDIWIDANDDTTPNTNALSFNTRIASGGTTYTLASDLSDYPDLVVESAATAANTILIPTDANAAYPVGTQIQVFQSGVGQTTISAVSSGTTTVVGTPGVKLRAQYSFATLIKRAANYWVVVGDTTV